MFMVRVRVMFMVRVMIRVRVRDVRRCVRPSPPGPSAECLEGERP